MARSSTVQVSVLSRLFRPKHDIRYRQQVGTDDVLGAPWSVKDNSSMSCREMIVKVREGEGGSQKLTGCFLFSGRDAQYQVLHDQAGCDQERVSGSVP